MVLYFSMWFKNGLKAQKLLAQGIALVNTDANLSPCKGKSFIITKYLKLLPLQGALLFAIIPRAMPWARSFCPFRACGANLGKFFFISPSAYFAQSNDPVGGFRYPSFQVRRYTHLRYSFGIAYLGQMPLKEAF